MSYLGNAPVFPTESVLPGNLQVTGNATISGSSATVNGNEVRTVGTSGAILQVVHFSTSTNTATTSSTFTDTALTASITPTSSSNKIMVHVVANAGWSRSSSASWAGGLRILRDSTVIDTPADSSGPISFYTAIFGQTANPGISRAQQSFFAYDSPATTSSVTYKAQIASRDGVAQTELNTTGTTNATSHIILMEVVA